ncbi:MAG: hypothetical protein LBC50_00225 [Candidatus Ancillula sp.]|jgi:preprotein translocase subunit SecG|nr:hypothetical protein [Candidatus Ancillula sp.]
MFRKLYTPFAFICALLIIVFAFTQGANVSNDSVNADADIELNGENTAIITTSQGVLDQVNTTVNLSIEVADNVQVKSAIGRFSDVQAWVDGINHYSISGLKDWSAENVQEDSGTAVEIESLQVNSDMWDSYYENTGSANITWVKKANLSWSLLLVLETTDGSALSNVKVSFSWQQSDSNNLTIILLILAIIILVSAVLLNVLWRSQSRRGSHAGDSKRLADMINTPTGEFVLPKSSQIPNVREFAALKKNMDAQSNLLTGHVTDVGAYYNSGFQSTQNSFFVSPVEDNNWRYYDASSSQKEYYDAQISRTTDFTQNKNSFVANNASNSISDITQFNAAQKLEDANDATVKSLSRKELRQSGFFQKKPKKRGEDD